MSGAQFRREVGTDPQRWAREFLVAYEAAPYDAVRTAADREAFVTQWFRDAMAAASGQTSRRLDEALAEAFGREDALQRLTAMDDKEATHGA